jgi:hypothetical protein
MSELRDDELRDALWGASGDECDTGTALGQVEARVRRIRRRRMDIAGVGLLVALVVALVVASRTRADNAPNRPASVVTAAPPVTSALPTTTPSTAAPADTTAVPSTDLVAAGAPAPADATAPATDDTTPPDESAAEMATADDPGSTATADPPAAASRPAAPPASAHANRTEQTFTGVGGRVTVAVTDRGLTFVSASARYGYVAGQPVVGATSVEIDFRSRTARSRIHVDLVDGRLVPTISNDDGRDRRPGRTPSTTAAASATTNAGGAGGDGTGATTGGSGTTGGSSDGGTGSSGTGSSTGPASTGTTATTAGSHWGDRSGRG